ncbi:MAG: HD-GYP domain-containing protein [Actinobacteria bacterium]|nr:MAG: HD-GYP domain-containing protein [Actinomycetota bacterium]
MDHNRDVLRKIRLWGFVTIMVVGVIVAVVVGREVQMVVVRGAGTVVASGSTTLVESCLDVDAAGTLTPASLSGLGELVSARNAGDDRMLFRVMDRDGRVLFSTMSEQVGEEPEEEELDAVVAGKTHIGIVDTAGNAALGDITDERAIEVLTPLAMPGTDTIIGVVETYKPYSEVAASARKAAFIVWIPVVVGALVSFAGLSWILNRATAEAREHEVEVASLNDRLHDSMMTLEGQSLGTLQALSAAVDEKDSYTARHSLGVTNWAHIIGVAAGLTTAEQATLERAGLLHDIGKIGVPESVLLKPSKLTDEEFAQIREHPEAGARILEAIPFLEDTVSVVRHHHERWDGSGYPDGLSGEQIPYLARVLAVADAYDAMTTDRPYRQAMPAEAARRELFACAGSQFDPDVVALFVRDSLADA